MKRDVQERARRLISRLVPGGQRGRWRVPSAGTSHATPHGAPQGPPRPEHPVAVIGDIHGRMDLLERLLDKLAAEAPDARPVFVGDYVDRGAESRAVLERLRALGSSATCLMGNHEAMLLEFLDDTLERAGRWLRNGGRETLASYGVDLAESPDIDALMAARDAFAEALSDGTERWLRARPLFWQTGNLLVNHAGPDPARPISAQQDDVFLWGHRRFLRDARRDGLWVAHGHWVRPDARAGDGRIAVDTGAWAFGRLSAALILPDGRLRFIDVRGRGMA